MTCTFLKITGFPRGTLFSMLSDAYSFDSRCAECWADDWQAFDDFFFDNPRIAERYGFISAIDGIPAGFVSWDPRHRPEYEEIGHNCILSKYKHRGYGTLQMREALRRIALDRPDKIIVTTSALMVPAQKMYESAGFCKIGERPSSHFSGNLIDYEYRFETKIGPAVFRPGESHSPDSERVRDFLLELDSPLFTFARWDWMITHPLLNRAWLEKIGLWTLPDGTLCAAALYDCQPGETYLLALPGYQNLYPEMIGYATRHLNPGSHFSLVISDGDCEQEKSAVSAGFRKSGDTESVAMFDIQKSAIDFSLPEGFSLTDMAQTPQPAEFALTICRGFEDDPLPALTPDFQAQAQARMSRPHLDPALKIAIVAPDGRFVCACGFWYDAKSSFAVIEPLCTVPEYRKLGLARAAVYEGIRRVAALGVTKVLVGSDREFYYRIGFSPRMTAAKWEKQ